MVPSPVGEERIVSLFSIFVYIDNQRALFYVDSYNPSASYSFLFVCLFIFVVVVL